MVCASGPVPPSPAAICSMWRISRAVSTENTRTPPTGCSARVIVTGISSPSRANTVYAWASWNRLAERP